MKNRGITLVELIISIALISIVIVFLFRLLVDVRYGENKIDYARVFQQQRALIMKAVQDDFVDNELKFVNDNSSLCSGNCTMIQFVYNNETNKYSNLSVYKNKIEYTNLSGVKESWEIKENLSFDCLLPIKFIGYDEILQDQNDFSFSLKIPLKIRGENKNVFDDIELTYIGKKRSIDNPSAIDNLSKKSTLGISCS